MPSVSCSKVPASIARTAAPPRRPRATAPNRRRRPPTLARRSPPKPTGTAQLRTRPPRRRRQRRLRPAVPRAALRRSAQPQARCQQGFRTQPLWLWTKGTVPPLVLNVSDMTRLVNRVRRPCRCVAGPMKRHAPRRRFLRDLRRAVSWHRRKLAIVAAVAAVLSAVAAAAPPASPTVDVVRATTNLASGAIV